MSTEPNDKQKQEARQIVERFSLHKVQLIEPPTNRQYHFDVEELIDVIASSLSSRDTEIREVLEGLRFRHGCWCELPPNAGSPDHTNACLAARALWERVQGSVKHNPPPS